MKKHLILMAAMISLGITNNCEAQDTVKNDKDAVCEKAEDCKSKVCTDNKCAQGTMKRHETVNYHDECSSGKAVQVPNDDDYEGLALICD